MNQVVELSPVVKKAQIALTVIGLCAIVLSFVSFTGDIRPLADVLFNWGFFDELWLLAAPCIILPIPISMGYVLRLTTGRQPQWVVNTSYALAALFACTSMAALTLNGPYAPELMAMTLLFAAAFTSAAWFSIRRIRRDSGLRGLVAMQCVYAVPMTFWVAFARYAQDDFQSGAWLGVITLLAYLTQTALAANSRWSVLAVIVPTASVIALMNLTQQFW